VVEQSDLHDTKSPFECWRIVPGLNRK